MCINEKQCQAWISLKSVGISVQGCMKDSKWLNSISIPSNQSIFNQSIYIDLPTEKLTCIRTVSHGKFGYIDLALYETNNTQKEVYVKRPILSGKNLLYEACVQKIVGDNLVNIGFPTGVPKIISIFKLRDNSICFAMEQIDNSCTLDKYLESMTIHNITTIIVDCLLQLSTMIWYLNNKLGINHRDLKPSNFLIVEHNKPIRRILNIENEILEVESRHSLTFIDFGFSCLGDTISHISDISLSTVYPKTDPCPKEGRDMYLFICFMYIEYYNKLPPKLIELFESWLDMPSSNICKFMRKDKEYSKQWVYFISGNDKITKFNSCPQRIVKDLQMFMNLS